MPPALQFELGKVDKTLASLVAQGLGLTIPTKGSPRDYVYFSEFSTVQETTSFRWHQRSSPIAVTLVQGLRGIVAM